MSSDSIIGFFIETILPHLKTALLILFFGIFFSFIVAGLVGNIINLIKNKQSLKWQQTTGRLVRAKLVKDYNSDDEISYKPDVYYQYKAEGKWYDSHTVMFREWGSTTDADEEKAFIESLLEKIQQQQPLTVYFNPKKPSESVLLHNDNFIYYLKQTGFMVMVLATLMAVMLQPFREPTQKQNENDRIITQEDSAAFMEKVGPYIDKGLRKIDQILYPENY